jgi:hypothetical protein
MQQIAMFAAALCLSALPAGAIGLYSVNAGFHVEATLSGSGPASGDAFGSAVAAGDFNGDGVADLATGIPGDDTLGPSVGMVLVRLGAAGRGLTGSVTKIAGPSDYGTGYALASGDFNGDHFDDLAISGTGGHGYVRVYFGSSSGLVTWAAQYFDESTPGIGGNSCPPVGTCNEERSLVYRGLGSALAAADFNGDTFDDLAIGNGAYSSDFDHFAGRMIVVYGSPSGLATSSLRVFTQDLPGMDGSDESEDFFGAALAAGDFDGDGLADLVVGVPGENDGGGFQVIYGSSTGLTALGNQLWTQDDSGVPDVDETGDNLGYALAVADFDGDGFDDVAVAAPYEDVEQPDGSVVTDAGRVQVFPGSAAGITTDNAFAMDQSSTTLGESEGWDVWGQAMAAGDFDRDGFDDLAIAAPGEYLEGFAAVGEVTILHGSPLSLTKEAGKVFQQNKPGVPDANEQGDLFGRALAAGDFDGNGYTDLAVGGPGESTGTFTGNGAEWVLYGYLFADGFELATLAAWQQATSNPRGANNVFASPVTGLGPPESVEALRVNLLDPASVASLPAWVMAGPTGGFVNETKLTGSFFIDPQSLVMTNVFQMMAFKEGSGASKTRLAFDLTRVAATNTWAIIANSWNDSVNALQFVGSANFATVGDPNGHNTRIDYEWRAGNPGHLTVWKTRYVGGVPDSAGRVQVISADLPGTQSGKINNVFAGMVSGQTAGTHGALYLDEFAFSD